ncbi:MAG: aspartate/glutamate racemase family protein [Clostridiales bacterium]|nr:aspartate/glutamate racemase family protein [Clostridiales bacterium]
MKKRVAVIHTSFVSVNDLKNLFKEIVPLVEMINIVDDSLLDEVKKNGELTANVTRRICTYALEAQTMGVDLILNQCSSVGEAVDVVRKMLNIPYLKVDEPMVEEAVKIGGNIAVVATVQSTLGPSTRLVDRTAKKLGRNVKIKACLVDGALDILMKEGDKDKHNRMVLDIIKREAKSSDVIILAQGSMVSLLPFLDEIRVPVFTSPRLGVMRVKEVLGI